MAANNLAIFTKNGHIESVLVTAANTSSQGGGTIATDIFKAFTATADGSFVQRIRCIPTATAATTTTATVARIYVSSVTSGATTSANTFLLAEVTLPAIAADNATAAAAFFEIALNLVLPNAYTILITNHAAPAANTAWRFVVIAGDY
jgi:hypothetical protein